MTVAEASRVRTKQIVPKWLIVFGVVSIVAMAVYGMARVFVIFVVVPPVINNGPVIVVNVDDVIKLFLIKLFFDHVIILFKY